MDRRNTLQKTLVIDAVQQLDHPNAECVFEYISKTHPHISKATVYRNLNILAEQNVIQKIETGSGSSIFDYRLEPHCHLRCRVCGKLIDSPLHLQELFQNKTISTEKFTIERCNLEFIGICDDCKKKKQKQENQLLCKKN